LRERRKPRISKSKSDTSESEEKPQETKSEWKLKIFFLIYKMEE
jgi:hypothetical protein